MEIDSVFDIETEKWDRFVCGGFYDGKDYQVSWNEDDFANLILSAGRNSWAWNGGLYDALWLANWSEKHGISFDCSFAGTRVTRLHCNKLLLCDAVALIPMTLQKASGMVGPEMSKETGLPCECQQDCGGYCSIKRHGMPYEHKLSLESYLKIDVLKTWDILHCLKEHAERFDFDITSTVGGSAWKTAKRRLSLGAAVWQNGSDYDKARQGYYGGRVFVGITGAATEAETGPDGFRFDINSAYPAALRSVALPIGNYAIVSDETASACFVRERPGIYTATVRVPEMLIPPLPWRSPKDRICYPVGIVKGTWTLLELQYAISVGVIVIVIHEAVVWGETAVIFSDWMDELFRIRSIYGKKHALGAWQKWFANSLTGKFAERPIKQRMLINPDINDIRACNPFDESCRRRGCRIGYCSGECGSWTPIRYNGNLWMQSYWRLSDCAHIQWAAYLTAATRIKWHRASTAAGQENVLYGDTDSLYLTARLPDSFIGKELGQWDYEGPLSNWHCLSPKSYYYLDDDGEAIAKGKGLPNITPPLWLRFAAGEVITTERGVSGLKSATRGRINKESGDREYSLFQRKHVERQRHGDSKYVGDRIQLGDSRGSTRPITCAEQLVRERGEE